MLSRHTRATAITMVVVALLALLVPSFASSARAEESSSDAIPSIPASILPRIRALERAFGIGEAARQRALLAESANNATRTSQMIDQSGSPCSSQSCSSCGELNMASLGGSSPMLGSDQNTDYYGLQFCNSASMLTFSGGSGSYTCSAANTAFCQAHGGTTYAIAYSTSQPTWSYVNNVLSYSQAGASDCIQGGVPRSMQVTFSCGSGANSITSITAPASPTASFCTWAVAISTSLVCGISADTLSGGGSDGGGGGSKSGGLSGGWVFIIILIVFTSVYLIGGALFMHFKRGAQTAGEHCPNAEFWKDLPSLVKDGCVFTYTRLRGACCGAAYSTV